MSIRSRIVSQFAQPNGLFGHVAGYVMANRVSNIERNLWTVNLLKIDPNDNVLEIGCGPGIGLKAAAAMLDRGTVTGVDHSTAMLAQAKRRLREEIDKGSCDLKLGGLETLENSIRKYDKIFSANVVQFFPDKTSAFKIIFEALASDGVVASTYQPRHKNPSRSDAFAMADQIANAMDRVGLIDIEVHELPINPVPAICVTGVKK